MGAPTAQVPTVATASTATPSPPPSQPFVAEMVIDDKASAAPPVVSVCQPYRCEAVCRELLGGCADPRTGVGAPGRGPRRRGRRVRNRLRLSRGRRF